METMGSRLRSQRQHLGMNQDALAEIGGVKRGAQIKYEAGDREPTAGYLAAIARAGIDVMYVLTGLRCVSIAQMSESMRERYNRLVDDFTALPDDLQIVACDYVGGLALRALREDRSPLIKKRSIALDVAQAILDSRSNVSGSIQPMATADPVSQRVGRRGITDGRLLQDEQRAYKKKGA